MDLSLMALGGLAAAMALDAAPDPVPAAPRETPVSCEDAPSEAAKNKCRRDRNELDPLTVDGAKRGDTEGRTEPELELDEKAIDALGVNTIGELMSRLETMTRGTRGRNGDEPPVFLINSQPATSPQEVGGMPVEAVLKSSLLREEEALAYGYRADQRVFNLILKPRFKAISVQADGRVLTGGSRATTEPQVNLFRSDGKGRTSITARYKRDSPLYEDERGVVRTSSGAPYDLTGNVVGTGMGGEIDPALSALVEGPVTVASVPASAAGGAPTLADFVAGAGQAAGEGLTTSRTLLPRAEEGELQASYTRNFDRMTATVSGNLKAANTVSWRGLPGVMLTIPDDSPFSPFAGDVTLYRYIDARESLRAETNTQSAQAALSLSGLTKARWRWTFLGNVDRSDSASRNGRGLDTSALRAAIAAGDPTVNPFGEIRPDLLRYAPRDTADSVATGARADLTLIGPLLRLPAGELRATFKVGADTRRVDSESVRSGLRIDRVLVRDRRTLSASLSAPVASQDGPLSFLGDVSLNLNGLYEDFSDIGGLATVGGGVSWSPKRGLSFSANYSREEGEPTPQQVNGPVLQTSNVPVYDYATGQTAFVTTISGGNSGLRPDDRQVFKLNLNYKPFQARNLRFTADYTVTRIDDQISEFPSASPELEAAFPSRFTRDAAGRLTAFDRRGVNFAHADTAEITWRLSEVRQWGGPKPGTGPNTWFVALSHRWRLRDEVVISEGMAPLDRLNGASLGQWGAARRHTVDLNASVGLPTFSIGGFAMWRSSTWVDGGARGQDLRFSATPTLLLYGSLNLGKMKSLTKNRPWLAGTKLTINLENLLDSYQRVRDAQGRTPEAYQEALMKTAGGRAVKLTLRKQF